MVPLISPALIVFAITEHSLYLLSIPIIPQFTIALRFLDIFAYPRITKTLSEGFNRGVYSISVTFPLNFSIKKAVCSPLKVTRRDIYMDFVRSQVLSQGK